MMYNVQYSIVPIQRKIRSTLYNSTYNPENRWTKLIATNNIGDGGVGKWSTQPCNEAMHIKYGV